MKIPFLKLLGISPEEGFNILVFSKFFHESVICIYTSIANQPENGLECFKNKGVDATT